MEEPVLASKLEDKCNSLLFSELCQVLEKMAKSTGTANKLKLIFTPQLKEKLAGQSVYPLLRLLLPLNDTERGKYGLKQASIAKTYVSALHLDKNSEDAKRLLNWKDPTKQHGIELSKLITGDFGLILEDVLKSRVQAESCTHTLQQVNQLLDSLAFAITAEEKAQIIRQQVLTSFNATEQKWLMRIVFQDLKVGLRHENVLSAFYPTALKRYNECTNLRIVCEEEGTASLITGVQLFVHFSPMLAKGFPNSVNGQVHTVESALRNQHLLLDLKLDGERCLIHVGEDNSFVIYTRRGNDYTETYWPVAHDVINCFRKRTKSAFIVDGEICALDGTSKIVMPFGSNMSVARLEREYGANKQDQLGWHTDLPNWMCFVAFDLVFLQGEDSQPEMDRVMTECGIDAAQVQTNVYGEITHLPLLVRRRLLESLMEVREHRVEVVKHKYITSDNVEARRKELAEHFEQVIADGQEGLVVKSLSSPYILGEKSRSASTCKEGVVWCKMKPEYGDYIEDIDLVIIGGYYGEGARSREGVSTFLCAVVEYTVDGETIYHSLAKVGTGYNMAELTELREKLKPAIVPSRGDAPPAFIAHWKPSKKDDKPDVYYDPTVSVVLQIKCAELVQSTSFSAGWTCRFPRVSRIRYDKRPNEIMKLGDIVNLGRQPKGRVVRASQNIDDDDNEPGESQHRRSKRKATASQDQPVVSRRREALVDTQFTLSQSKAVGVEGQIFKNKTYCVPENDFVTTSGVKYTRQEIADYICRQQGHVVASASYPNCQVIAGNKRTVQLKNIIAQGKSDVIDFGYIIECLEANYLIPIRAYDFLGCSAETRKMLAGDYDIYGDSYVEAITPAVLLKVVNAVDSAVLRNDGKESSAYKSLMGKTWRQIAHTELEDDEEEELFSSHVSTCLYRRSVIIYIDMYKSLGALTIPESSLHVHAPLPFNLKDMRSDLSASEVNLLRALAARLYAKGAMLSRCLHTQVSHVVFVRSDRRDVSQRLIAIQERNTALQQLPELYISKHVVTVNWLEDCLAKNAISDAEAFKVKS